MRVAIYLRVSTEQQAKEGDSLQEQESTLVGYANNQGWDVMGIYKDEGISGTKLDRDEHKRLMQDVKDKKIDIIIFTFLSRWFRNLKHYLNTQDTLDKHNVVWKAVREDYFNTQTPAGRAMIAQMMTFGQLEAEMTSERIKAVFDHKIASGEVVSGQTPLGYKIIPNPQGKGKILVPDKNAKIVRDIFDFYIKSGSLRKTTLHFFDRYGISRSPQATKSFLKNKKYIGEHRGNRNFCEPIIDKEKFEMVQKLLSKNIKNNGNHIYIFSGILKCACCGGSVHGTLHKSKWTTKEGTKTRDVKKYRCARHFRNKYQCPNKSQMTEKRIEEYLIKNIQAKLRAYENERKVASSGYKNDTKVEVAKMKGKIDRYKQLYLNDFIEMSEFKKETNALQKEIDKLENRPTKISYTHVSSIMDKSFANAYNLATDDEKREIWRSIIDKIIINDHREIEIVFLQ